MRKVSQDVRGSSKTRAAFFPSTIYTTPTTTSRKTMGTSDNNTVSSSISITAIKPSLQNLSRPSSSLSRSSSAPSSYTSTVSNTSNSSPPYIALKDERDLLERMVKERDENVISLQKTIEMQKEYMASMQTKYDQEQERQKKEATRQKLYLQSVTHEKNTVVKQLKVLQMENQRIKDDSIYRALNKGIGGDGGNEALPAPGKKIDGTVGDNEGVRNLESDPMGIKILDGDKRILGLQSQLYNAMNSLSTLQRQTTALKESYDEIVSELQREVMDLEEDKAQMEVKLLSQLAILDRQKAIGEELLQTKIQARDTRIKRLEKRIQKLDRINDDESIDEEDGDDSGFMKNRNDSPYSPTADTHSTILEDDESLEMSNNSGSDSDNEKSKKVKNHVEINGLLAELEMLSAHSSSRKLFA